MEKFINDTLKWYEENQNQADARELFTAKIQETEEFFAPFYANATGIFRLDFNRNVFFF